MSASFRQQMIVACVLAALIPGALLAVPLISRLDAALRRDAEARLALVTDRLGAKADRHVEILAARAAAMANDSDLRRAGRVPIFLTKTDVLLRKFLQSNPEVVAAFYLDHDGRPITAAPIGIDLRLGPAALAAIAAPPPMAAAGPSAPVDAGVLGNWSAAIEGLTEGPAFVLRTPVRIGGPAGAGSLALIAPWSAFASKIAGSESGWTELGDGGTTLAGVGARGQGALVTSKVAILSALAAPGAAFALSHSEPEVAVFRAAEAARRALTGVTAGGFIVLGVGAFLIGRHLVRPVGVLRDFIAEYARGNLTAEPPQFAAREFRAVAQQLQVMAEHVRAAMAATERRAAIETALMRAELDTLKNQLKPHFLFNALNGIAALAHDQAASAPAALTKLAELYRLILATSGQPLHPLVQEVAICRYYLELEALRFGRRLAFTIDDHAAPATLPVPCLLLQTLVENAVKHGVAPALAGGRIDLVITPTADGGAAVTVTNTGEPLAPGFVMGTGLNNTRRRLDLLYPDRHGLNIERVPDATVVSLTLHPPLGGRSSA